MVQRFKPGDFVLFGVLKPKLIGVIEKATLSRHRTQASYHIEYWSDDILRVVELWDEELEIAG